MAGILHEAQVTTVNESGVYVAVPNFGAGEYGPCPTVPFALTSGDAVLVGSLEDTREALVIIGPLVNTPAEAYSGILAFDDAVDRAAYYTSPPVEDPTFTYTRDDLMLWVWNPDTEEWDQLSWDETRIVAIEQAVSDLEADMADVQDAIADLNLNALLDVTITGPAAGQTLRHDGALWVNAALSQNDLGDTTISSPSTGEMLTYDGAGWINGRPTLDDLTGVVVNSPEEGDILQHNGTYFENSKVLAMHPNAGGDEVLTVQDPADSAPGFSINSSGDHAWGDGAVAGVYDTDLYREGPGYLRTSGGFTADNTIYAANGLVLGPNAVTVTATGGSGNTTSATYVTLTAVGTTFVAPPSGTVVLHYSCQRTGTGAGYVNFATVEVREGASLGAGTVVLAKSDSHALLSVAPANDTNGMAILLAGLTAGQTYNIQFWHRNGGSNTINLGNRWIVVTPAI